MRTFAVVVLALCGGVLLSGQDTEPRFEVVSVKENTSSNDLVQFPPQPVDGYRQSNLELANYVTYAFDISESTRVVGLPEWTRSVRYDISAKAAGQITETERRVMVRDLLRTRFGLRSHSESREQTVYLMTIARADKKLGPGIKPRSDCTPANPCSAGGSGRPDGLSLRAITLTRLAEAALSSRLRQVVRDETGIPGVFDVAASWRPESATPDPTDSRPSMFTALEEQLGLKLVPSKRSVEVLVIDHIERPSEN